MRPRNATEQRNLAEAMQVDRQMLNAMRAALDSDRESSTKRTRSCITDAIRVQQAVAQGGCLADQSASSETLRNYRADLAACRLGGRANRGSRRATYPMERVELGENRYRLHAHETVDKVRARFASAGPCLRADSRPRDPPTLPSSDDRR